MTAESPDRTGDVGSVLAALADPTRRTILEAVATRGPLTATALAGELPVSRQAVSKHLERLAAAGLVVAEQRGRETQWSATPEPLAVAAAWFEEVDAAWDRRLASLADRVRDRRRGDRSP